MQLVLAQLPGREGDIAHNLNEALAVITDQGPEVSLIVFPETHLTGFAEEGHTTDRALSLNGPEIARLIETSREQDCALALGLLERDGEQVFNTSILITPEDGVALRYRKTHLWPDERDLVTPGNQLGCTKWRDYTIGLMICYDLEFPEVARSMTQLGADLLIVTNGNMDPYGPVHTRAAQARAQDNQCFLAMTNRCGEGAGFTFAGGSALIAPDGALLFQAGRDRDITALSLDYQHLVDARRYYDYLSDRRIGLEGSREDSPRGPIWRFD
ncbi:carbon-nitrogen hydrolase family protein [Halomonas caseinilytica]|uniref:(R)-amidase n=1 Tax=Halomonas caseinilytica TaxID=438744 RepID=A0A1M6W910_9GAMM|nr:carbon-nitrogen hydrolase family protein [Halomonas caseinilytica]SHK90177.1 (R)-amidase [Halomonas caseinilytica]